MHSYIIAHSDVVVDLDNIKWVQQEMQQITVLLNAFAQIFSLAQLSAVKLLHFAVHSLGLD